MYTLTPNYTTTTSSHSSAQALPVLLALALVGLFLIISMWRVFSKAGKHGWAAIIPIYNIWTLLEIGGKPGWLSLLAFIPFVGWLVVLVVEIIALLEVARRFGKGSAFGFFMLFFPLSFIGWPILAFGKAQYQSPAAPSGAGGAVVPPPAAGQPPVAPTTTPTPPTPPTAPTPPTV